MFFVAEIHSIEDRFQFYESLCTYLVANNGIRNIVLEDGHAEDWLLNAYLRHGDTTYFRYFPKDRVMRHFLDHLRTINDGLPEAQKLNIRGMDFERMFYAIAAREILSRNPGTNHTIFYKYIFSIPDSALRKMSMTNEQHKMRRKEVPRSQQIFAQSKDTLEREMAKEDFAALKLIFENPNTEQKWGRRDKGMYENIMQQQLMKEPFLCIVGRNHTEYKRSGNPFHKSLMKTILRRDKGISKKIAVIDEVRNGAYREQHLFSSAGFQEKMSYGTAGPAYFIKSDTAMSLGYSKYFKPDSYILVHKDVFTNIIEKDNHHLDSWYVFFGEPPAKKALGK